MRTYRAGIFLFFLLAGPGWSQRGGGHAGGGHVGGGFRGGGSIGRVGGFTRGGYSRGFSAGHGHGPYGFRRGFGWGYGLGFYSPWFWGSPDYSFYTAPTPYFPDVPPPVVINQQYLPEPVVPQVREYPPPLPPPTPPNGGLNEYGQNPSPDREPLYLLATKDGTIRAVLAYWAEGDTVHYVTMDHARKAVPLASIDRELSFRLNRERGVSFGLPR